MVKFYYVLGLVDLLHLWLKVVTFMVSVTIMVNFYYIYDWYCITFMVVQVITIYGQILFHLWLVVLLHLRLKVITITVSITVMVNSYYIYGWYYIHGFYYIYE